MVIKMSKRLIFVFSADDSKTSVSVWASERSYLALSENAMDYWVLSYISKISALENILFLFFLFFFVLVDLAVFLTFLCHER